MVFYVTIGFRLINNNRELYMEQITNKIKSYFLLPLMMIFSLGISNSVFAQEESSEPTEEEIQAQIEKIMKELNPQHGEVSLINGAVKLSLGDKYYFLDQAASKRVLTEYWGNPEDSTIIGMIFPKKYTPFDEQSWAATLEYVEDGYVSDEEASSIDYDDLLKDMKKETREESKERVKAGFDSIELVGWAEPPHYDSQTNKLYWGQNLKFGNSESNTLNYNIRVLGRKGYLVVNFIANMSQLDEINESREEVLALTEFSSGYRYADFDSSTDKVAKYGVAALVAGAVAKKAGLLAILLVFLKKFGIFIFAGIAALFSRLRKK